MQREREELELKTDEAKLTEMHIIINIIIQASNQQQLSIYTSKQLPTETFQKV